MHHSGDSLERTRVEWTHDHRTCTATAVDAGGRPALVVTFHNGSPILDPIARQRMENEALAALQRLLDP
jgi:hypothetical protein